MTSTLTRPTIARSEYVLGYGASEEDRLIRQATPVAPLTERLFREAGIGRGQRVLDIGSGVGDVSMIAARLVGPSGEVVGIERDASYVARASDRVAAVALRNVTFMTAIEEIFTRSRGTSGCGLDLFEIFHDAGVGVPAMHLEMPMGLDASIAELQTDLLRALLPAEKEAGVSVAELAPLDTLAERVHAALLEARAPICFVALVGAWSRKPG